ncbi:MAG: pentapeptide repeat-containing protein [Chlorobium sp.]
MDSKVVHLFRSLLVCAAFGNFFEPKVWAYNTSDVNVLRSGVASWNSMRALHKESIPDLSGADLKGRNLRQIDLHNANLSGALLSQSDLSNADLKNSSLEHAHLNGSLLIKAILENAVLRGADLEGAVLYGANFHKAILEGGILKKADCTNADMRESNLRDCNFREASMVNTDLRGADLRGIYLWRANMSRANINGVTVSEKTILESGKPASNMWAENHGAFFVVDRPPSTSTTSLTAIQSGKKSSAPANTLVDTAQSVARLSNDKPLSDIVVENSAETSGPKNIWSQGTPSKTAYNIFQYQQLKSNVFAWNDRRKQNKNMNIDLTEAPLDHKNLSYADLSNAKLSDANFRGADLSNCNLRFADLRGCDFQEANMEHADLYGADLRGANLWRANLDRAQLNGGKVSNKTILTSGKKATVELSVRLGLIFISE